jgi:hypothetical protein
MEKLKTISDIRLPIRVPSISLALEGLFTSRPSRISRTGFKKGLYSMDTITKLRMRKARAITEG